MPPYHADWSSDTQSIVLNNRLILDSTCTGTCDFTYNAESSAMQITATSHDRRMA
jgi:hypothetical protein